MLCYDNISSSILAGRVASYSAPCTEIPGQNKLLMTAAKYFIQLDIYLLWQVTKSVHALHNIIL